MKWIDNVIQQLTDLVGSNDVYIILDYLEIELRYLHNDNILLKDREAFYTRSDTKELIYISEGLNREFEHFIIAHEIGHAVLHTHLHEASYRSFNNEDKCENQADYFAIRLLNKHFDSIYYEGYTSESIAKALHVSENSLNYLD